MHKSCLKSFAIISAIALAGGGTAFAEPLVAGKPAGVHAAQMTSKELLVFGGLAAVGAVILIASAGGGHGATAVPITVVNTV
jgi:hypothetical protein